MKLEKWSDLVQHRDTHRQEQAKGEEEGRRESCLTCGKQFRNRANLRKHGQVASTHFRKNYIKNCFCGRII